MADFYEKLKLKGKAEEDRFFAELDKQLIEALHRKNQQNIDWAEEHLTPKDNPFSEESNSNK